ncbi:hypothetical protein CCHL11_05145 [Colletotrichum chlorophyti]|uniref:Uncharacterized protein n=1 Tax=Colletotrichum chlorophyti TaxID=708187 RepID=A0A1Q8S266_9PEZI|nr:hypothetical protein CCHL11_05145 [Colletotrichum chlorophyti]
MSNTTSRESSSATGLLIDIDSPHQICLDDLKASVPSEHASAGTVRLWLLQVLRNRNVALAHDPAAFVCLWTGSELHTLHPNHIFGVFTSHGLDSDTARTVVGDVIECLKDYRARRAACLAAGGVWHPKPELDPERRGLLADVETEAQVDQVDSPVTSTARTRAIILGSALAIIVGLGTLAWWMFRGSLDRLGKWLRGDSA